MTMGRTSSSLWHFFQTPSQSSGNMRKSIGAAMPTKWTHSKNPIPPRSHDSRQLRCPRPPLSRINARAHCLRLFDPRTPTCPANSQEFGRSNLLPDLYLQLPKHLIHKPHTLPALRLSQRASIAINNLGYAKLKDAKLPSLNSSPNRLGHFPNSPNKVSKLLWQQGLLPIALRILGTIMDLAHDGISASSHRSQCHRCHMLA